MASTPRSLKTFLQRASRTDPFIHSFFDPELLIDWSIDLFVYLFDVFFLLGQHTSYLTLHFLVVTCKFEPVLNCMVHQHLCLPPSPGSRSHVELPFYSKYLLLAAYLASYNPAKTDRRFFTKQGQRNMSKRAKLAAKADRSNTQLTGMEHFELSEGSFSNSQHQHWNT